VLIQEIWRQEYPFESQWHQLADGCRMHFVSEGSGEPVLMIHGNPTWSFYYRHLVQALGDSHRAIAVDHIGCGLSDKPQQYEYCLAQHTQNLLSLIETLDLSSIHFVVHDWGGAIGLGVAAQIVERVKSLTILNTGAFPPPYIPWRIYSLRAPILGTFAIRALNMFAGPAVSMAMHRNRLSKTARAGLLAPYNSWHNRVAVNGFVKDIPFSKSHPSRQTLLGVEAGLSKLADKPVQFIWGMKDWCFNAKCLAIFKKHFPQARSLEIPDAGHYVMEDARNEVVGGVQAFLRQLS